MERLQQNLQNDTDESQSEDAMSSYVTAVSYQPSAHLDMSTMVQRFSDPNIRKGSIDEYLHSSNSLSLNSICAYEDSAFTNESNQLFWRPDTVLSEPAGDSGQNEDQDKVYSLSPDLVNYKKSMHPSINVTASKAKGSTFTGKSSEVSGKNRDSIIKKKVKLQVIYRWY